MTYRTRDEIQQDGNLMAFFGIAISSLPFLIAGAMYLKSGLPWNDFIVTNSEAEEMEIRRQVETFGNYGGGHYMPSPSDRYTFSYGNGHYMPTKK